MPRFLLNYLAMLKFALIADAHVGPEKPYEGQVRKLSRHALPYLAQIGGEIDSLLAPDFVVQLGDLIEDADDRAIDMDNYKLGLSAFYTMNAPVLHVVGNHDQVNLGGRDLTLLIGRERLYYSVDLKGYHCVVLFSSSVGHTDIRIDAEQRAWLAADLAATEKPTLVFLHHPLDDQSLVGNVWFEKYPDYCFVEEKESIRQMLSSSQKVVAVFNGHVHQNSLSTIDGIHYVTVQSLVEKVGQPDVSSRAFALVTVEGSNLRIDVQGEDPVHHQVPLRLALPAY